MKYCVVGMTIGYFCLPFFAQAVVSINEVAWMGDSDSANNEWIELRNDGASSVDVEGWTLSDGMNFNITLAGSIAAGSYAVLERTDDDSAPGTAFMIYAGALTNAGATLVLKDAAGATQDQVVGGENWESIGGDNTTKETAQYTSSGWVTAVATPGQAANTIAPPAEEEKEEVIESKTSGSSGGGGSSSSRKPETKKLELPDVSLDLDIKAPDIAYVNQVVSFDVEPDGLGKTIMNSLKYDWNFGDAHTKKGKSVAHVYSYPGTYAVVVHGAYARHEQVARHEITVLPVSFSITRTKEGDVQIHNDAKYEVDLSGYSISGGDMMILPRNSILLPNSTLTIPKQKLKAHTLTPIAVYDQTGDVVTQTQSTNSVTTPTQAAPQPLAVRTSTQTITAQVESPAAVISVPTEEVVELSQEVSVAQPATSFSFQSESAILKPLPEIDLSVATSTTVASEEVPPANMPPEKSTTSSGLTASAANSRVLPDEALPYLGLLGVIGVALLGLYAGRLN